MTVAVDVRPDAHRATITFDRPEVKNAMSMAMVEEVRDVVRETAARDAVRVVVLTGSGDTFCAGADFEEFGARADDPAAELEYIRTTDEVKRAIETCEVPVVAKLNGAAVGLGAEIALASDIRVACHDASLTLGEINVALVPPFERLSKNLSDALVRELCFTGNDLAASKAFEADVYNRLVDRAELDAATEEIVDPIAEKSPHALEQTKRAFKASEGKSLDESNEFRYLLDYQCFDHPDFRESIDAISEGREPDYT
ncbi:enoyl-CoA hydratase/isomerase family protein [Haloplanus sp. GCM10025708]|uniref:enoyl-CoA hydratase/isomerase family protein n=1 Tax=Haloferacaceae TaxID=1644056 RepID=UPI0036074340